MSKINALSASSLDRGADAAGDDLQLMRGAEPALKLRILLVEDDEDDYFVASELMDDLPYTVELVWAERFDDGLTHLLEDAFDIAFVDYRIGGRTGLEFIESVKSQGIDTPLVLLTGAAAREIDIAATKAGASDFLDKSELSASILERTIRFVIANADAMRALSEKSNLLTTTLEHTSAGIAAIDRGGRIIQSNRQFAEFLEKMRDKCGGGDLEDSAVIRELLAARGTEFGGALEIQDRAGRIFEVRVNSAPDGGIVIFTLDVSEAKRQEKQLQDYALALEDAKRIAEHQAQYDALTGLANRRHLDSFLERLGSLDGKDEQIGILHIDLDRFKHINDTLGHAAGDHVLRHVAATLNAVVRSDDFKARIGGDEFVVICKPPVDEPVIRGLGERIVQALAQPIVYEGQSCRFGASVGVAFADIKNLDAHQLLINADLALYEAKRNGRNRVEFFSPALQDTLIKTKRLADEFINAIRRDEIEPFFQPQFDAQTLELKGVEALARWRHPIRGLLAPGEFLNVAEDLELTAELDRIILEKSLAAEELLRAMGADIPKISVNVSFNRLQSSGWVENLNKDGASKAKISLELLETISLDDSCSSISMNIDALRERGFDLEIDDFGSGRASIVGLLNIGPARLKIDRRLVIPMVNSENPRRLVQAIIEMANSLSIGVTAEGVETKEHVRMLRTLGCGTLQGFALSHPMPREDLAQFILRKEWLRWRF